MLSKLANIQTFSSYGRKLKSVRQRMKYYSRFPDMFRLKTRIRPPDLTDPELAFPIRIPIRYRHELKFRKELYIDNTSKIHWNRLEPNQILLGFENTQYLTFEEVVEGLRCLSEVKNQDMHNWNEH